MLSPIDVHYLVGFLSSVGQPDGVELELGALVLDESTGTKRDVDVSVTRRTAAGIECFRGIEVKAESRPLDVVAVEQLCAKLNDMPNLTGRAVVSASGYTAPAARKAERHGVDLLRLDDLDASRYTLGATVFSPDLFLEHRRFVPNLEVSFLIVDSRGRPFMPKAGSHVVGLGGNRLGNVPNLQALAQLISQEVVGRHRQLQDASRAKADAITNVDERVAMTESRAVQVGRRRYPIRGARVTGTICCEVEKVKPRFKALVRHSDAKPFVDCLVAEMPDGELLLAAAQGVPSRVTLCELPLSARNRAKIRSERWPLRRST